MLCCGEGKLSFLAREFLQLFIYYLLMLATFNTHARDIDLLW